MLGWVIVLSLGNGILVVHGGFGAALAPGTRVGHLLGADAAPRLEVTLGKHLEDTNLVSKIAREGLPDRCCICSPGTSTSGTPWTRWRSEARRGCSGRRSPEIPYFNFYPRVTRPLYFRISNAVVFVILFASVSLLFIFLSSLVNSTRSPAGSAWRLKCRQNGECYGIESERRDLQEV